LASIGTNRNARRAALANTLFKVLGVIIMLGMFYVRVDGVPVFLVAINKITTGNVFAEQPENIGRHVAAAHTLFNILNVIVFLPFVGVIASICRFVLPVENDGDAPTLLLEPHLLSQPSVAIQQTMTALRAMSREACRLTDHAVEAFVEKDLGELEKLFEAEERIDQYQHDIMQYLVELNRRQLNEQHAAAIPIIMHCVNDVERVGDRATNILELAEDSEKLDEPFSADANDEIRELSTRIQAQGDYLTDCFENGSVDAMNRALKLTGEIKELVKRAERHHEERLHKDQCSVKKGIIFVEVLSNLGRIADHLGNIAERSPEMFKHHLEFRHPAGEPTPTTAPEPTPS
ncbi:MAG: Na/Pi cotransporter family protein, partial [Lentisphaeria bacterium]|nr:Na/Pi cotransporter family protein [Lentisphaeria bacterium]